MKRIVRVSLLLLVAVVCAMGRSKVTVSPRPVSPVRHFVHVDESRIPDSVLRRDFCHTDSIACLRDLRSGLKVWTADVNGDGVGELLVHPGAEAIGSCGLGFYFYRRTGNEWQHIDGEVAHDTESADQEDAAAWCIDRPRLEILPITRNGYRDLRLGADQCFKWVGQKYVPYEPADYRALLPAWFDSADPQEAEIFWLMRYAGRDTADFEPQWFPVPLCFLNADTKDCRPFSVRSWWPTPSDLPTSTRAELADIEGLRWVSLNRAGVWGIQGTRGFLLVPRTSSLGACTLTIAGDWLAGSETCGEFDPQQEADFRYNRANKKLQVIHSWNCGED